MTYYKIKINGIEVTEERGHYLLSKDGITMTCDPAELNSALMEFEFYYLSKVS